MQYSFSLFYSIKVEHVYAFESITALFGLTLAQVVLHPHFPQLVPKRTAGLFLQLGLTESVNRL
jgi:hypothetical protein